MSTWQPKNTLDLSQVIGKLSGSAVPPKNIQWRSSSKTGALTGNGFSKSFTSKNHESSVQHGVDEHAYSKSTFSSPKPSFNLATMVIPTRNSERYNSDDSSDSNNTDICSSDRRSIPSSRQAPSSNNVGENGLAKPITKYVSMLTKSVASSRQVEGALPKVDINKVPVPLDKVSVPRKASMSNQQLRKRHSTLQLQEGLPEAHPSSSELRSSNDVVISTNGTKDCHSDSLSTLDNAKHQMLQDQVLELRMQVEIYEQRIREMDQLLENAKKAHEAEVDGLRSKIKEITETIRGSIANQEAERQSEQQAMMEMYKQLAAATKVVNAFKDQSAILSAENERLKSNETNLLFRLALLEEEANSNAEFLDESRGTYEDVKAARSEIDALLTEHQREISEWSAECVRLQLRTKVSKRTIGTQTSNLPRSPTLKSYSPEAKNSSGIKKPVSSIEIAQTTLAGPLGTESPPLIPSLPGCTEIESIPPLVRRNTITSANSYESNLECWWSRVVNQSEGELQKIGSSAWKGQKSLAEMLSTINHILAEKIVHDELDDREGLPRLTLSEFLYIYFLRGTGGAAEAQDSLVILLVNVLIHVTRTTDTASTAMQPKNSHRRIIMFARFLGLESDVISRLGLDELNLYLAGLRITSRGAVLELPVSNESAMVPLSEMIDALDWMFARVRSVIREKIKLDVTQLATEYDRDRVLIIDLEQSLEFAIEQFTALSLQYDVRLEALFTGSEASRFDLKFFNNMMRNLGSDECDLPTLNIRLRIFMEICMLPSADGNTFVNIARRHRLYSVKIGPERGAVRPDLRRMQLLDPLIPKCDAAKGFFSSDIIGDDISNEGGLLRRWKILQEMMRIKDEPELAVILYQTTLRLYVERRRLMDQSCRTQRTSSADHVSEADSGNIALARHKSSPDLRAVRKAAIYSPPTRPSAC